MNWLIKSLIGLLLIGCNVLSCGGNKKNDNSKLGILALIATRTSGGSEDTTNDGLYQELSVTSGTSVTATYNATTSSIQGVSSAITTGTDNETKVEVSVVDSDGQEQTYLRNGDGSLTVNFTPTKTGTYRINFKNNSDKVVSLNNSGTTGGTINGSVASSNSKAKFKDIFLKAYVGFSPQCAQLNSSGSGNNTFTAASGSYFVQPFVFLGKVGSGKRVTEITTATITVSFGGKTLTLKRLSDMDVTMYNQPNNPSNSIPDSDTTNKIKYVKSFYQGFFGGAGEMYTLDTFNKSKGASCNTADTFALGATNPGQSTVTLKIVDTTNGLNEEFKIRPSATDSYLNFYTNSGTAFSNYDTCGYNNTTGEPYNYSTSASTCPKSFSSIDPPYGQLNSSLANDLSFPTRAFLFGYSTPKTYYSSLITNSTALSNGSLKSITIDGCLNNGGLASVQLSTTKKTYLPLKEFNVQKGDVIQLGTKLGSYTNLGNFYQGNVDLSGSVDLPVCIPSGGQSCPTYKTITINSKKCRVKVDSGIAIGNVSATWSSSSNNFIYPDSVGGGLSGVISE